MKGVTVIFGVSYKEVLCLLSPHAPTARLQLSVCIVKNLCTCCCYIYQWRVREFLHMSWRSSVLAITACNNSEIAIFSIYYKEALYPPLLYASMARPWFSTYVIKKFCARCHCKATTARPRFSVNIKKKLCAHCCYMHERQDCNFLYELSIKKKPCARHCYMHQWRDSDFRYVS